MPVKVPCKVCKELIQEGAKKCVHCDSFQNWRKFFHISSNVLALLVALVSVISIGTPIIKESLRADNSEIKTVVHQSGVGGVALFVYNTGNRDGGLGNFAQIIIKHPNNDEYIVEIPLIQLSQDGLPQIIKAGSSTQIIYERDISLTEREIEKYSKENNAQATDEIIQLMDKLIFFLDEIDNDDSQVVCILVVPVLDFNGDSLEERNIRIPCKNISSLQLGFIEDAAKILGYKPNE